MIFIKEDCDTWPAVGKYLWRVRDGTALLCYYDDTWTTFYLRTIIKNSERLDDGDTYYPCDSDGLVDAGVFEPEVDGEYLVSLETSCGQIYHRLTHWSRDHWTRYSDIMYWTFIPGQPLPEQPAQGRQSYGWVC